MVVTGARTAEAAIATNADQMDVVEQRINELGLETDEYERGAARIDPVYDNHGARWTKRGMVGSIAGFQVTNVIEVLTSKLELAGELIETAVEAGANRIDSIGFALSDPGPHRDEAIRLAARRALHEAEVLAEASLPAS